MQATNKNDAAQVYEGAERATKVGIKDSFKYFLKPLTIFSYHYFVEGIKAVQKDGPTKELEKITNLSYDETIRIMEKCQKDGIRVVASERNLAGNSEFGKNKSLHEQKRITRFSRRIKTLSNFKVHFPKLSKYLQVNRIMNIYEKRQDEQVKSHQNKRYNIIFNKSKQTYMNDRIADLIEYRTRISKDLFDENTQSAIENAKEEGLALNAQQLKDLSDKLHLHEFGDVAVEEFKKDYCIHSMPFSAFMSIQDELDAVEIPYGIRVTKDEEENKETANIYFENKHLERYSELGFNQTGQIRVYGSENKNLQWNIKSQDELISFTTKTGEQEKQTYETLSGKNYIMKRNENECVWTVLKTDVKELAEKEKKRNVVNEDLEKHNIFENLQKEISSTIEIKDDKNLDINILDEKEVGE